MIAIKVLEPKYLSNPRDVFVATCVAMFGDADEFKDFRLAPIQRTPGHEEQLEELVQLLDAMEDFSWVEDREYSDLANYAKWFPAEADYSIGWYGGDPFIDENGFIATLRRYEISYYDKDGIEYAVSITR